MTKRINVLTTIGGGTGQMTVAGNPYTVADGFADEVVNRGVAVLVDPPAPIGADVSLVQFTTAARFAALNKGAFGTVYEITDLPNRPQYRWNGTAFVTIGGASGVKPGLVLVSTRCGTPNVGLANGGFTGWGGTAANQPGVCGVLTVPISTQGAGMVPGVYPLNFSGGSPSTAAAGTYSVSAAGICTGVTYSPGIAYTAVPTCTAGGFPGGTLPTFTGVTIGATAKEFNVHHSIIIQEACSDLVLRFGNVMPNQAAPILTEPGPTAVTLRVGELVSGSNEPVQCFWPTGSKDIKLEPGAYSNTLPIPLSFAAGSRIFLQTRAIYDAPPAYWPASAGQIQTNGSEVVEFGSGLTDRTMATDPFFGTHVTSFTMLPPLCVLGRPTSSAPRARVAVLCDSIGSIGNLDNTYGDNIGFVTRSLAALGYSFTNIGAGGSGVVNFMQQTRAQRALKYAAISNAGITHCITNWVTNDLSGQSYDNTPDIISAHMALNAEMLAMSIKTIVMTCCPRTGSANTGSAPGDNAGTLGWRRNVNVALRQMGPSCFDAAFYTQEPTNIDRWRLDLNPGNVDPIHPNGPTHDALTVAFSAALPTLLSVTLA